MTPTPTPGLGAAIASTFEAATEAVQGLSSRLTAPLFPESTRYQRSILFGLNRHGKHVYAGTVPADEVARRRAANRRARAARRITRRAA
jgi:hypothetical protein